MVRKPEKKTTFDVIVSVCAQVLELFSGIAFPRVIKILVF